MTSPPSPPSPSKSNGVKSSADGENLNVVIRVRPFVEYEKGTTRVLEVYESFSGTKRNQVIELKNVKGAKFTFDYVLQSNTTQRQVYDACVVGLADKVMEGYNATIIAYGQTGSGKTWTIIGPGLTRSTDPDNEDGSPAQEAVSEELDGVVPRALKDIFNRLDEAAKGGFKYAVKLQFLELYGETIRDLLVPSPTKVTIRDLGGDSEPKVIGATQQSIKSAAEALHILEKGALRRATGSTKMNAESSRSHALMTVYISRQTKDGKVSSKFQFVDLAGSERLKKTGAEGKRKKEGIDINKGLLTLANVISALGDPKKKKGFVPYRDSKLTHLLKGSIGGNHKTLMIACVSPAASNAIETENSLRYANRAKNIQNRAVVNMDASTTDTNALKSQVKALAVELLRVRGVAGASAGGGPFTSGTLASLAGGKDVKDLEETIARSSNASEDKIKKLEKELSDAKLQMYETNIELEHVRSSEKEHKRKIVALSTTVEDSRAELEKVKKEQALSSLARVSIEEKISKNDIDVEELRKALEEERAKTATLVDPSTLPSIDEEKVHDLEEELETLQDKYDTMKSFYEEKLASMDALIDQKEEERGQLIVEIDQIRNGPKKEANEEVGDSIKMEDVLQVRLMSMRVLPLLLEDETQRAIAQRNGLTDAILQEMALFSDSVDFNAAAFHALVLLARPLGGKEGSLFQGSMINSDILSSDGVGDEMNGIEIMLNAMRRFDSNELLQAKGCWAIVNIALVSTQRTMLLKRGGLSVVTNAMRRHPYDTEVQLRAVSALVNMVKPFDVIEGEQNKEKELLDSMVDSIADLVVQAMKNCCSHEVILSRACLVLGNLSFRKSYKTSLVETPDCMEMLEWCYDTYLDNKLIQKCTRDTLVRLGKKFPPKPPKPNKSKSSTAEESSKNTKNNIERSRSSSSSLTAALQEQGQISQDSLSNSDTTRTGTLTQDDDDLSAITSSSERSSVIASQRQRKSEKRFSFFRSKSKRGS